jgi:hypothetical protein
MVRRPLAGLAMMTELALLHAPGDAAGDMAVFWGHAKQRFAA